MIGITTVNFDVECFIEVLTWQQGYAVNMVACQAMQANICVGRRNQSFIFFLFYGYFISMELKNNTCNKICQAIAGAGGAQSFETISESVFLLRLFQVHQVKIENQEKSRNRASKK